MANKKQLIAIAKELGIDVDLTWKKSQIQAAIDEKSATENIEEETQTKEEPVAEEVTPELDSKPEIEKDPEPVPETVSAPTPVPEALQNAMEKISERTEREYVCITNLTYAGRPYVPGATVTLRDDFAKPHLRDGAIRLAKATDVKKAVEKSLPAGEYKLVYGITLAGKAHASDAIVSLTSEQAILFAGLGAIEPLK